MLCMNLHFPFAKLIMILLFKIAGFGGGDDIVMLTGSLSSVTSSPAPSSMETTGIPGASLYLLSFSPY